LSELLSEL